MDTLIERTEKALLGAVLLDRSHLADIAFLDPADFQNPDHRRIYITAVQVAAAYPDAQGAAFTDLIAQVLHADGVSQEQLHGLALNAPEPEYAAVYARMVQEAGVRADLRAHAARLETQGIVAGGQEGAHLLLLSEALTSQARMLDSVPVPSVERGAEAARTVQEREILADLLQHPEQIHEVRAWLDVEVFDPGPRRDIYAAILTVADRREPATELTVAWELGRRQAMVPFASPSATIPDELPTLTRANVETGAAVRQGHQLLADRLQEQLTSAAQRVDAPAPVDQRSRSIAHGSPAPLPPPPTITPDGPTPKR